MYGKASRETDARLWARMGQRECRESKKCKRHVKESIDRTWWRTMGVHGRGRINVDSSPGLLDTGNDLV